MHCQHEANATHPLAQSRDAQSVRRRRPLDQSDDMERVTDAHIAVRIEHILVECRLKLAARDAEKAAVDMPQPLKQLADRTLALVGREAQLARCSIDGARQAGHRRTEWHRPADSTHARSPATMYCFTSCPNESGGA